MRLWADVNGCKQKENRKGGRKEKKEGLTAGSGHECAVRTLPNKDKLFEQCLNSTPLHGGLFKHCSNTWTRSITCPNTVQTVFEQHMKQCVMSEHCLKCSNIAKQGQTVRIVFEQHTTAWQTVQTLFECMEREDNMSKHCLKCSNSTPPHGGLFRHCSNAWKQVYNFMSEHCLDSTQSSA